MNKIKQFFAILKYLIKSIAIILYYLFKFIFLLLPVLFAEIYKFINQRLRFSITFKTTAAYILIFSIILLLLGTVISSLFAYFLFAQTNASLEKNSLVIDSFIHENTELPRNKIKNYAAIEGITVILFDPSGQTIYRSSASNTAGSDSPRTQLSKNSYLDRYHFYYEAPVKLPHGIRKIEISKQISQEETYLMGLIIGLGTSFLLILLITAVIGASTSRRMLRPIDNMTRTARLISAGDLSTRLDPVDSHDELKELALTFNEMLDRIQHSFDQQNVFVSDASHELRTPISVIQGYANLLQRWGSEEPNVLAESIDAIKSEADYMKELVEKLLFLASTDKKKQRLESQPFPLHELITEVVKETGLIDSKHEISSMRNDAIMLYGDRALIKQALRIFIDNSLKFTPAGGLIEISSVVQGKKALITVKDNGIGIAAEDLPQIFHRFYKADKSRNREGSGAGLGLSIAKWIIGQHQGELKVDSILGKGTTIIISLPLARHL